MTEYHQLQVTSSPGGLLFECEQGCGRRLVVDRAGKLTIIDRGDFYAQHKGSIGGVKFATPEVRQAQTNSWRPPTPRGRHDS